MSSSSGSVGAGVDRRGVLGLVAAAAAVAALGAQCAAAETASLSPRYPAPTGPDALKALLEYTPAADPDAAYFRSLTPRAARIAPFAATQAHPKLDPRARTASLMRCHGALDPAAGDLYTKMRQGVAPPAGVQVTRMLGYMDIVVSWAGTGMIPNPALTDAAHRNGALCLGLIFQPDRRMFDGSAADRDRVAAKFVEWAQYFGFDGYFLNLENYTPEDQRAALEIVARMRARAKAERLPDFHVQYYNGHTGMSSLAPISGTGAGGTAANSVMLDQGWSTYGGPGNCCSGRPVTAADVEAYCQIHGLDPFETAYFGLQLYPGPGYLSLAAPLVIAPNGAGPAHGSLQLYSLDDGVRDMWRAEAAPPSTPPPAGRASLENLYALERMVFSGASQDPAFDNAPDTAQQQAYERTVNGRRRYTDYQGGAARPTDQMALPISYGVANFITEGSPISALPFVSCFNTGEGDAFHVAGRRSSSTPWFNMGAQDVLPTWQWRRQPLIPRPGASPTPRLLEVGYDFQTAYDGGASLRLAGRLDADNATWVWLYKCALALTPDVELQLVSTRPQAGATLQIGLTFQDAPASTVWITLADPAAPEADVEALAGSWLRTRLPLAAFAGRTLAALSLGCLASDAATPPRHVEIHVGALYVGRPKPAPTRAPAGFRVAASTRDAKGRLSLRLAWIHDPAARHYDVFVRRLGQDAQWLARINGDRLHLSDVEAGPDAVLELAATRQDSPLKASPRASLAIPRRRS